MLCQTRVYLFGGHPVFNRLILNKRKQIVVGNDAVRQAFVLTFNEVAVHRMDKRKFFVFPRQYTHCFSRRINAPVLRN